MPSANESWKDKRVIVTGGAGFIGSVLVWELNRRGCSQIVIADYQPPVKKHPNLEGLNFTDYVDPSDLLGWLKSSSLGPIDTIFHLGACSSTTETNEKYLRENNFEYSRKLAEWALDNAVRFVYASSAATYGDGEAGMEDTDPLELELLQPLNLYGLSKHWMDLHAWRHGWLEKIAGLKYFNVFGPNENHKGDMRSVVCKSYAQVLDTGAIHLFKSHRHDFHDGEQRRDFLYVKDAVAMTLHVATNPAANGIFNIGSGKMHTWNELARAVFAALGREPRIEYIDMPESIREKYQYSTQADIRKLLSTGYDRPITSLEDAVRDYVVNYLVPGRSIAAE
jgi:ADP-L-glycero-D-manno-heptose 6-epimerase